MRARFSCCNDLAKRTWPILLPIRPSRCISSATRRFLAFNDLLPGFNRCGTQLEQIVFVLVLFCIRFWEGAAMLTRKQHELLMFIHERLKESGIPPSFDEMKEALDLASKSGIHRLDHRSGGARLYPQASEQGASAGSHQASRFHCARSQFRTQVLSQRYRGKSRQADK